MSQNTTAPLLCFNVVTYSEILSSLNPLFLTLESTDLLRITYRQLEFLNTVNGWLLQWYCCCFVITTTYWPIGYHFWLYIILQWTDFQYRTSWDLDAGNPGIRNWEKRPAVPINSYCIFLSNLVHRLKQFTCWFIRRRTLWLFGFLMVRYWKCMSRNCRIWQKV